MKLFFINLYQKIKKIVLNRQLRFDLLTTFFIMQSITVITITSFMHQTHTDSLTEIAETLMNTTSQEKIEKILYQFNMIGRSITLGSQLVNTPDDIDVHNMTLIRFLANYVKNTPACTSVFVASKTGRFLQATEAKPKATYKTIAGKALPKNTHIEIRFINTVDQKKTETWYYIDDNYTVIDSENIPELEISLNFLTREWWKNAIDLDALSWSSIYIFSTTQLPGIAASYPIHDKKNNIIGVMGSDVELISLSNILEKQSFGGRSVIINKAGEVIAHPTQKDTAKIVGKEVKLLSLENADDKYLESAYAERQRTKKDQIIYKYNNTEYIAQFIDFNSDMLKNWVFLSVAPFDVFIGHVKQAQKKVFYMCLAILLLSTIIISYITLRISKPIHYLVAQADRIRMFDLSEVPLVHSSIREIQKLQDSISRMRHSLEAFGKFVPKNLVRSLVDKDADVKIGGRKKRITLLFSDIEGFTSISETLSADRLLTHISEYFDELSTIIIREHGTIDKYIGDSIMAFWGAPGADAKHTVHACAAALFCQKRLTDLNRKWIYDKKPPLNTRIGIHTGDVIVGNLGSSERMNYTALGDSVNLASRLEGVNKQYGTYLIISESVLKEAGEHVIVRPLDIVSVKGKKEGIAIYELVALSGDDPYLLPTSDEMDLCVMFEKAFKHYYEQRFDDAIDGFEKIALRFPSDRPTQIYIERCKYLKENPPGKEWDHIHRLTEK